MKITSESYKKLMITIRELGLEKCRVGKFKRTPTECEICVSVEGKEKVKVSKIPPGYKYIGKYSGYEKTDTIQTAKQDEQHE